MRLPRQAQSSKQFLEAASKRETGKVVDAAVGCLLWVRQPAIPLRRVQAHLRFTILLTDVRAAKLFLRPGLRIVHGEWLFDGRCHFGCNICKLCSYALAVSVTACRQWRTAKTFGPIEVDDTTYQMRCEKCPRQDTVVISCEHPSAEQRRVMTVRRLKRIYYVRSVEQYPAAPP